MTKVKIIKKNNNITQVVADGHTGYGVSGEDIVCAALSSIVQTAVLRLLTVAGVSADVKRDDDRGFIDCKLPTGLSDQQLHDSNIILNTMLMGISDLSQNYSDFIELEVIEDVY